MPCSYLRSHDCATLRKEHIGQKVHLSGWIHRRRDHGGLIFIDLRDRFGLTQLVFDPEKYLEIHTIAETLRSEWVITIEGEVIPRAEGMTNLKLRTGEIEILVKKIEILSKAKTPPFSICDEFIEVNEELRLKHRYLDMRRGKIMRNLIIRHKLMQSLRSFLDQRRFLEISTPVLGKSTPEGARDYLVPSRIYPGTFYALPQSPQIFKQLLMVGGIDRYFQIAPCFRDEDLRSERQPEFTQLDIEMSFEEQETFFPVIEELLRNAFKQVAGINLPNNFPRISYNECLEKYGTDKPDLRFNMELIRLDEIVNTSSFSVFLDQLQAGGCIKGIVVKGGADISRKGIDLYTKFVGTLGIRGLAWMKCQEEGLSSSIVKFFDESIQQQLIEHTNLKPGDLIFMVADQENRVNQSLDHLRRKIAQDRNLIDPNKMEILWVTDFPLLLWDEESERFEAAHHPFTSPHPDDFALLESDPAKARSLAYDLVLNGYEIAGGSQRIHNPETQDLMFKTLNLSSKDIQEKFGFFVEALSYGTPPHLGIAFGIDRLCMILCQTESIRDVVAFPKTQKAHDLMMESPSYVTPSQLLELGISIKQEEKSWR